MEIGSIIGVPGSVYNNSALMIVDSQNSRIPSFTDRHLFKSQNQLQQLGKPIETPDASKRQIAMSADEAAVKIAQLEKELK